MSMLANAIDAFALLLASVVLTGSARRASIGGVAAFISFALAVAGVLVAAPATVPEWTRMIAVATMVVGFYAVIAVLDPVDGAPGGDDDDYGHDRETPLDPDRGPGWQEPEWWPEFERQFADYVSRRSANLPRSARRERPALRPRRRGASGLH